MKLRLHHIEDTAPYVKTFYFEPLSVLRFEPGQFIEICIPHKDADDRGEYREFSISSSPHEPLVAITIDIAPDRPSSFKRALWKLRSSDVIDAKETMGDFILPKDPTIPLVFLAAGIGCTPYASMIKWLSHKKEHRDIQFVYSTSTPGELLFMDLWQHYPMKFLPIVTQATGDWHGLAGRLNTDRFISFIEPIKNKYIYLAGPQSFIEPLYNDLLRFGIPRPQLLLDYFPGY